MASLLLPACAITLVLFLFSPAQTFAAVIVDIKGEPLKNGGLYYILPHLYGTGGLIVTPGANNSSAQCPLYITQQLYSTGSPIMISSPLRIGILKTGFSLELYFHVPNVCDAPLRWWVAPKDSNDQSFVVVGVGSGKFKPTYFFKIEEDKKGKYVYNIKFCHVLESRIMGPIFFNEEQECNDVGFLENGLLGITPNEPYPVVFEKVARNLAAQY